MRRAVLVLLMALLVAGCILEDVPLEGRMCPCVGGFVCDEATNICVREQATGDAGVPDGGG